MAFSQIQFYSKTLNVSSTVYVLLPESDQGIGVMAHGNTQEPKVLYLLHGYSDDHSIWMRRTSVERYAAAAGIAVIMPAVNHSYYCNEKYGERYWDYVSEELPMLMHSFFRLSDKPEDTYVAGLSMGGYGAMKLALTFPERFAAAGSFSGAVDVISEMKDLKGDELFRWQRIFAEPAAEAGGPNDLLALSKKNSNAPNKPRLYVSCGTADFLYGHHLTFTDALKRNGWDVTTYEKPDVKHEWSFWDEQIKFFIPWMLDKNGNK